MRLGQISRKYNLKPTQVRDFIQNKFKVVIDLDPNTKIDDEHVSAIAKKFENLPVSEPLPAASEPVTETKAAAELVKPVTVGSAVAAPETAEPETVTETTENQPGESTEGGMDAFIPRPVDPDAELIKAPKIKLDGLKVVGKIELPSKKVEEPAGTEAETETEAEAGTGTVTGKRMGRGRSKDVAAAAEGDEEYSIYKDKRGIYHFSNTQRENRKKSLERIRLAKLEKGKKKSKASHYEKTVKQLSEEARIKKKKEKDQVREERLKKSIQKPAPKGLFGKFLHWLKG